jgi:O-succinylbenzoic acid--CoA ligase
MHELSILAAAREAPEAECLIGEDRVWSYADVARRVRPAMDALRARGIVGGDRVALTPEVDVDSMVWLYALFELGCPAVLLHPRLSARERAGVLDASRPAHVIADDPPPTDERGPAELEPEPISDNRLLAIAYTSGSRGQARGARLSRRAFIASASAHAANLGWLPEDRWLLCMPPAHVGGLSILTRCLIARRCVVLCSGPFASSRVIRTMSRHRVTLLSVVPTMLHRLLNSDEPPWTPDPELRAVLVGGAPFPDSLRERAAKRNIPTLATYGCTEACSQVATQTLWQRGTRGSGAPLPGIEIRIVEDEIQIRGPVLMDGYLVEDRSEEPFTSDGWLRTGDLGCFLPDGQLLVRGRRDDVIVTGGENVAPQEIEEWLQTVPGITAACVFSVPDEEWGERVVAAIVTDPSRYDPDVLRARLEEGLAAHKRPKGICVLDSLPLNRSGKVDRALTAARCEGRLRPI